MKHVLVVDDSHVIRRLVEVVLGQLQLDVRTAASGGEAIDAMDDRAPDLVVLDVGLPDIPGWDVLTHVRETPDLCDGAVIMLTGRSDADDIDRAERLGATAYLTKPFRPDELRRVVLETIHGGARATA